MPQQASDQARPQSGSGPFRLSLQLPEKRRQQLQERKQTTTQPTNNNGSGSGSSSSGGSVQPSGPMTPGAGNSTGNFYGNSPSSKNMNNAQSGNGGNSAMNPGVAASYIHQQAPEGFGDSPVPTQYPFTIGMHFPGYTAADHQAVQQARTTPMNNAAGMNMMQQQAGQMAAPLPSAMANNPHSYIPMGMGPGAIGGQTEGTSPGGSIASYNDQGTMSGNPGNTAGQGQAGGSHLMPGVPDPETFEFMKRKRWPQLLMQELVGAAVWCLIPYDASPQTGPGRGRSGWKVIFASPATHELLGYKPEELEGNDWADFVYSIDLARLMQNIRAAIASSTEPLSSSPQQHHFQLSSSRTSAFDPPTVSTSVPMGSFAGPSKSLNVYTRMVCKDGKETLFELRGHPYFGDEYDEPGTPDSSGSNGGFDGGGVMGTTRAQRRTFQAGIGGGMMGMGDDDERSCKAFWIMGRKWQGQGDGGAKMLDSFLELKMENERLRQELRDLQARPFAARGSVSQYSAMPQSTSTSKTDNINSGYMGNNNSSDEDEDDDDDDNDDDDRGMPPPRNMSTSGPVGMQNIQFQTNESFQMGGGSLDDKKAKKPKLSKNPEYLCRNCGRNDSPEWRKGPLGPKTLCNACGLRWAKRNAGNIPRRKPKDKDKEDDKGGMPNMDTESLYDAGMMDMS